MLTSRTSLATTGHDKIEIRLAEAAGRSPNTATEIRNPLEDIPRNQLFEDVTRFHQDRGLPADILPVLKKGALVAQNPAGFESIGELNEQDVQALREEVTREWKHPWSLYYTIFLNSIAAAIQGWDQVRPPLV